jgi:opine dehydrogenase
MRVAIIGSGGIGRGYLAYLTHQGHHATLWSPSGAAKKHFAGGATLDVAGHLQMSFRPIVAPTCAEAIDRAEAIVIAVQASGFRSVLDEMAPYVKSGQTIIISSHSSFAALYLQRLLAQRGIDVPISAWATTALTARKTGSRGVYISGVRAKLDVATLPIRHEVAGRTVCQELFGDRFQQQEDILAIMLSNLNPPSHMANMLGNLTRAERGEEWPNYGSITRGVGRIVEAMDIERLRLAQAFGLKVRSIQEHFVYSFGVTPGPVDQMAAAVYKNRPDALGPKTLDTRYITEDVPFGLVPLETLGIIAGVSLPLHKAGIELFDAICARNFRGENNILPALNLEGLSASAVHGLLRGES